MKIKYYRNPAVRAALINNEYILYHTCRYERLVCRREIAQIWSKIEAGDSIDFAEMNYMLADAIAQLLEREYIICEEV